MLLKKTKTQSWLIFWILLGLLALIILKALFSSFGNDTVLGTQEDINEPTSLTITSNSLKEIILDKVNIVYSDSLVNIHAFNELGVVELLFVYRKNAYPKVLTDNFSTQVVLKDSTKTISGKDRIQFYNGPGIPEEVNIYGKRFLVFKQKLESDDYMGRYIDVNQIDHINTSRHVGGISSRYSIRNIRVDKLVGHRGVLEKFTIKLSDKNFEKIKKKRYEALRNGVLLSQDEDLVSAQLIDSNNVSQRAQLRLKGDWTQHLEDPRKWSMRVIMEGDNTFGGMRKFSLQAPVTRNYLWEWLFQKTIKDASIVGLRYKFVDLDLEITTDSINKIRPIGIMAVEESFDKILIENNRKREGLILALDESVVWNIVEKAFHLGMERQDPNSFAVQQIAPIRVFNQNKVLADPKLKKQFEVAKNLLEGFRSGHYKASEVFDLERLTTFVALTNLFGGYHGLWTFNLRFYYNPITNLLEPVCFDSNSGIKLDRIRHYPFIKDDPAYEKLLNEKLRIVSSTKFLTDLFKKYGEELGQLQSALSSEFDFAFDKEVLEYNSAVIKKAINPADVITAHFIEIKNQEIAVQIRNYTNHKVILDGVAHKDGRFLSKGSPIQLLPKEVKTVLFGLNEFFVNAFVSKKNKIGEFQYPKDLSKLNVKFYIDGVNYSRTRELIPYSYDVGLEESIIAHRAMFAANYSDFDFIEESNDTLYFNAGSYEISKNLVVPKNKYVRVAPGFTLNLKQNASLISFSTLYAKGMVDSPIIFTSDGSGGGIFVSGAAGNSLIEYCQFTNLANPQLNGWEVSGAVNFHESDVTINNSLFNKNRCEDGLNIISSNFVIDSSQFIDTQSDAFDGDFVTGTISNSEFINSGNDGIDVSGSILTLENIRINNPSDKGLSGGEASQITGKNITIIDGEIGVVSKDLSTIRIDKLVVRGTRLGLSSFQKKTEYGAGNIVITNLTLSNNELDYLIENRSKLTIDAIPVETVSNSVIDKMYGGEYGKSSG